jgi:nucleoside 2-deoxyribosyltransferase
MSVRARVYVASPLGFSQAGRLFYDTVLLPLVRGLGLDVLDPWTLTDPHRIAAVQAMPSGDARREAWRRLNHEIGATNRAAIDGARAVVAVLDGVDVDSGTAAEIGYAFARGKLIVGYRGDFRLSADNEGGIVNAQVEYFIRESGGTIVERYEDLAASLEPLRSAGGGPGSGPGVASTNSGTVSRTVGQRASPSGGQRASPSGGQRASPSGGPTGGDATGATA